MTPTTTATEGVRVGDHLTFAGDDYNVIAIDKNEVKLLAQSNQKKYTLPLRALSAKIPALHAADSRRT